MFYKHTLVLPSNFIKMPMSIRRCLHLGEHFTRGLRKEIELRAPVALAGRKYMPSSNSPGIPKFLSGPRDDFPLLLKAQNGQEATAAHWAKRSRDVIEEAFNKFEQDGSVVALLFRGLPIRNDKDFSEWVNDLGYQFGAFTKSTGLLPELASNVAAGSEDSNEYTIEPHNEQAYRPFYPKIFVMCCLLKAVRGGETAIGDSRKVGSKLEQSFLDKCEKKLLRYWQYLPDLKSTHLSNAYKSWQRQFGTDDRAKVEEYLSGEVFGGYSFEWEENNLFMFKDLPSTVVHPRSGDRVWFNQLAANHCSYLQAMPIYEGVQLPNKEYPHHTTFGDGEEIEQGLIDHVRCAKWESAVGFDWQDGDVLFMDNLTMQHSRLSFEGDWKVGISYLNY